MFSGDFIDALDMKVTRKMIIGHSLCLLFIMYPIAIISLVISNLKNQCEVTDMMGLSPHQYLLGLGISILIIETLIFSARFIIYCHQNGPICETTFLFYCCFNYIILEILNFIFGLVWFVIGGIILFRSNIECIESGGIMIGFAVAVWLSPFISFATLKVFSSFINFITLILGARIMQSILGRQ